MCDLGYEVLVKNQYPLGKTWITTSSELYKIVFGDSLFNEHVGTIRWNIKLLEDAFLRGLVLEELLEIKDAFITIFKLMGRYRFSFEATMESFIKNVVPSSLTALEKCGGNVNKLTAEDTFILLAETYEIMCCDMDLLVRCGIDEKDLRPQAIATNDKKFNFYYFGWDLIFCTTLVKIEGEIQESKPYAVAFNSAGFNYLFNNFISGNTRRKSRNMSAALIEMNEKMQQFTASMETRRLPSLRIQNKLRAPSQPVYEPLALRTRHRADKKEPVEPTREDLLKQQREGRAARAARRQEALEFEREKVFMNDVGIPPPTSPDNPDPAADKSDYLDELIDSVIMQAGQMIKSEKRKKRPKGANQFYDDNTFMPADDVKYIRVENLSGDVRAEVRKQMNKGRAARLEARNDPTSIKASTPEVSLSAAITNVKQQHVESPQQAFIQDESDDAVGTSVQNNTMGSSYNYQSEFTPSPRPASSTKPLFTPLTPYQSILQPRPTARPSISYRRPIISTGTSSLPTNALYRPVLSVSSSRNVYIQSPGNPYSTRIIRVIRQPSSSRYLSPILRPARSHLYLNNGTPMIRPSSIQPIRRVIPCENPRMTVQTNSSLKPGIYRQTAPNTFIQANKNLPASTVFPINSNNNGIEMKLSTNGKITENGVLNEMPPPLKHFDQEFGDVESFNGLKPEDKVLSANQTSNQHF